MRTSDNFELPLSGHLFWRELWANRVAQVQMSFDTLPWWRGDSLFITLTPLRCWRWSEDDSDGCWQWQRLWTLKGWGVSNSWSAWEWGSDCDQSTASTCSSELTHLIMIFALLNMMVAFDEDDESPSLMTMPSSISTRDDFSTMSNRLRRLSINICENAMVIWCDFFFLMILPRNSTEWSAVTLSTCLRLNAFWLFWEKFWTFSLSSEMMSLTYAIAMMLNLPEESLPMKEHGRIWLRLNKLNPLKYLSQVTLPWPWRISKTIELTSEFPDSWLRMLSLLRGLNKNESFWLVHRCVEKRWSKIGNCDPICGSDSSWEWAWESLWPERSSFQRIEILEHLI